MRRLRKVLTAVLAGAMVLSGTMGINSTVKADNGTWKNENGNWVYYLGDTKVTI